MKKVFLLLSYLQLLGFSFSQTNIGTTTYDIYTNASTFNRVSCLGDSATIITYMGSSDLIDPNFPDRGTEYNKLINGVWQNSTTTSNKVENVRTGWPELVLTNNSEIIVTHFSEGLLMSHRDITGVGTWIYDTIPNSLGAFWPRAVANGDSIFIVTTTQQDTVNGVQGGLYTFTSFNNGSTWLKDSIALINPSNFLSINADEYALDVKGSSIVLLVNSNLRLSLIKSTDFGSSWAMSDVTVLSSNPTYSGAVGETFSGKFISSNGSLDVVIDNNDISHVLFSGYEVEDDSSINGWSFYPLSTAIYYWEEGALPNSAIQLYYTKLHNETSVTKCSYDDDLVFSATDNSRSSYTTGGFSEFVRVSIDNMNNLYCLYSSVSPVNNNWDANNNFLRDIYLTRYKQSESKWSYPLNLTNTPFLEEVYPASPKRITTKLPLIYMSDSLSGNSSLNGNPIVTNNILYNEFNLVDLNNAMDTLVKCSNLLFSNLSNSQIQKGSNITAYYNYLSGGLSNGNLVILDLFKGNTLVQSDSLSSSNNVDSLTFSVACNAIEGNDYKLRFRTTSPVDTSEFIDCSVESAFSLIASSTSSAHHGDTARLTYTYGDCSFNTNNLVNIELYLDTVLISSNSISSFSNIGDLGIGIPYNIEESCNYKLRLRSTSPADTTDFVNLSVYNPNSTYFDEIDYAIKLDGINDYIDLGTWMDYTDFSVSFWVKPDSLQDFLATILDLQNDLGIYSNPNLEDNYVLAHLAQFDLLPNKWMYLTVTVDGNSNLRKVYLFGQLIAENTWNYSPITNYELWLGKGHSFYDGFWKGEVDELAFWNKVLNQNEIIQNMRLGLNGFEQNLEAYWDFNECISSNDSLSAFLDETVNNRIAQANGDPQLVPSTKPYLSQNIFPSSASNSDFVTISLVDFGFSDDAIFTLVHSSFPDIEADTVLVSSNGSELIASVNIIDADTGFYDVVVYQQSDTTTKVYPNGFEIVSGGTPSFWLDVVGNTNFRVGRDHDFMVVYGNDGLVEATGVPIWLSIEGDSLVDIETLFELDSFSYGLSSSYFDTIDWKFSPDSIGGIPFNGIVIPLFLKRVPANSIGWLSFKINNPNTNLKISVFNTEALFGNSLNKSGPTSAACISCLTSSVAGVVLDNLVGGCYNSLIQLNTNPLFEIAGSSGTINNSSATSMAGAFAWDLANVAWECGSTALPQTKAVQVAGLLFDLANAGLDAYDSFNCALDCTDESEPDNEVEQEVEPIASFDPNEKYGPTGVGNENFIVNNRSMLYKVSFENVDTATASAQVVTIVDTLDKNKLDVSTFRFLGYEIGDSIYTVDPNIKNEFLHFVKTPYSDAYKIRVEGVFNDSTGVLTYRFITVDTSTLQLTQDPIFGFLPPNVNSPEGEGSIIYSINQVPDLASGSLIKNDAKIIFDANLPIYTNEYRNTIDVDYPTSFISNLSSVTNDTIITLNINGSDPTSEVDYYEVYVSEEGGPFEKKIETEENVVNFIGKQGITYDFFSIAVDLLGNTEIKNATSETSTYVDLNTSIIEMEDAAIFLYPNPTNDYIIIEIDGELEIENLVVQDNLGRLINEISSAYSGNKYDVSYLSKGIYFLKVKLNGGEELVFRVLKK